MSIIYEGINILYLIWAFVFKKCISSSSNWICIIQLLNIINNKNKYLLLLKGGYANGSSASIIVKRSIIDLCLNLKNEAVTLSDALAPPDFILNSVIGASNGKVQSFTNKYPCSEKVQN